MKFDDITSKMKITLILKDKIISSQPKEKRMSGFQIPLELKIDFLENVILPPRNDWMVMESINHIRMTCYWTSGLELEFQSRVR